MATPAPKIVIKSPDLAAKKFLDRASTATPFYAYGVRNPKRSPTEAALSMRETLERKMALKETWDKWEKRRRAAGDAKWLSGIELKGIDRYPRGIEFGAAFWYDFFTKFKAKLEEVLAKVYSIPRVTVDDSVRRVETLIRGLYGWTYVPSALKPEDVKATVEKIRALRLT